MHLPIVECLLEKLLRLRCFAVFLQTTQQILAGWCQNQFVSETWRPRVVAGEHAQRVFNNKSTVARACSVVQTHAELGVDGEPLPELEELGAGLRLRFLLLCCARLVLLVRARVRNGPEVDDAMEARVVQEAPPVEVAEDAHVVGAVRKQRVPLARERELDGLQAAAGLDGDVVVLAEQVEPESVRRAEDAEAGGLEDVCRLEEPGGRRLLLELQGFVQGMSKRTPLKAQSESAALKTSMSSFLRRPRFCGSHAPTRPNSYARRSPVWKSCVQTTVTTLLAGSSPVVSMSKASIWRGVQAAASSSLFFLAQAS